MHPNDEVESQRSEHLKSETAHHFGPAVRAEIEGVIDLMLLRPPAFWMRKVSREELRVFLTYVVDGPNAVLLTARPWDGLAPIGYVCAIIDSRKFWGGFLLRKPLLAARVALYRLIRLSELRRKERAIAKENPAASGLPVFSWSPRREGWARIIGLYVLKEYHGQGIAMDLYFALFDALRAKGCTRVEEYAAPNYVEFAGKFPKVCGWSLQPCVCGGYKISRAL